MLYGPDGCVGDVHFGDSVKDSLRRIADALEEQNELLKEIAKELKESEGE